MQVMQNAIQWFLTLIFYNEDAIIFYNEDAIGW